MQSLHCFHLKSIGHFDIQSPLGTVNSNNQFSKNIQTWIFYQGGGLTLYVGVCLYNGLTLHDYGGLKPLAMSAPFQPSLCSYKQGALLALWPPIWLR